MLKLRLQYFGHLMQWMTHLKRPWCWERMRAGGEGDDRGWDGWMASPTWWTWVWVNSRRREGEGRLACCSPWGCRESATTATGHPQQYWPSEVFEVREDFIVWSSRQQHDHHQGSWLDMQTLRPTPDQLNQKVPFNKISRKRVHSHWRCTALRTISSFFRWKNKTSRALSYSLPLFSTWDSVWRVARFSITFWNESVHE